MLNFVTGFKLYLRFNLNLPEERSESYVKVCI